MNKYFFAAFLFVYALAAPLSYGANDISESIKKLEEQVQKLQQQVMELKKQDTGIEEGGHTKDSVTAEPMTASAEKGLLTVAANDNQFSWKFDSRLQFDTAGYFNANNNLSNGIEVRRARFAVKAKLWNDWRTEIDLDFADNEVDLKDAWIAYDGFGQNSEIKLGNFKMPFSLEEVTSSRMVTFLERGLPNVFPVGRRMGVSYTHWADRWRISGALFAQELDAFDESGNDESLGYSARFDYLPVHSSQSLWLVGASFASYQPDADSDNEVRFRTRSETHVERDRFLNTGKVSDVDAVNQFGFETAYQRGPLIVQGEYIRSELDRFSGNPDASYDGWYLFGSYILTGEQRPYNPVDAEFSVFTPERSTGAWEVALRASSLDLNDFEAGIFGGSADQYTLGLNWYPNRNLRIMMNYAIVDLDENADGDGDFVGGDDFSFAQARFQVVF